MGINNRPEFLIIGSGAGGATAFHELSNNGHEVVMLEEGREWTAQDFTQPVSSVTREIYRQNGVIPIYGRPVIAFGEGRCLGGTTEINGALLWRTPSWILDAWTQSGLQVWNKQSLEPHFAWVEKSLGVRLESIDNESNRDSNILALGATRLNWKVVQVPRAAPTCSHSNRCGSGCPVGGKASMSSTLIKSAQNFGGTVITNMTAVSLVKKGSTISKVVARSTKNGGQIEFQPKQVILSAGATQSSFLLRRSNISQSAGKSFCFHINLKVLAKFSSPVVGHKGTIFNQQIQEFAETDRFLIMASNLRPSYLAMSFSHVGGAKLSNLIKDLDYLGLYTVQVQPITRGRVIRFGDKLLLTHRLNLADWDTIRKSIMATARLLFTAGAISLELPLDGSQTCNSLQDVNTELQNARQSDYQISSVHMMSSNRMGVSPESSVVNQDGQIWGMDNLTVLDSSILPSWTCESPQGTIMAIVHKIVHNRFL